MKIDVALLPRLAGGIKSSVCVVVDVLRATTSLTCMAQAGVSRVIIASDADGARHTAAGLGQETLLCGEVGGMKPTDFHYGNSPTPYLDPSLVEHQLVFCSSNGARALHHADAAPILLAGAFVNAQTVASAAVTAAYEHQLDITIVCSGEAGGTSVNLEDTACAGLIVADIIALLHNLPASCELEDSAFVASQLFQSYLPVNATGLSAKRNATRHILTDCRAGQTLSSWGFVEDVLFAEQVDLFEAVMRIAVVDGQLLGSPLRSEFRDIDVGR